jgi:hypothetical protein
LLLLIPHRSAAGEGNIQNITADINQIVSMLHVSLLAVVF